MITRIQAEDYRCFKQLDLRLDEFQVIIGVNGAGKSTLLEIPVLLGHIQRSRVIEAFIPGQPDLPRRVHRLTELVHRGDGTTFALALEAQLPPAVVAQYKVMEGLDLIKVSKRKPIPSTLRYEVAFQVLPGDQDLEVTKEFLYLLPQGSSAPEGDEASPITSSQLVPKSWFPVLQRDDTIHPTITAELQKTKFPATFKDNTRLGLAAIPSGTTNFPAVSWFQEHLRALAAVYQPDWQALRRPVPPTSALLVAENALNIPNRAKWLQDNDPEQFRAWVAHVRTALTNVTDISAHENDSDKHVYLRVTYDTGYSVASSGLSEGTWRLLCLTLLPYLPPESVPGWFGIEEPETALHPHAISAVMDSLSSLYDHQVVVSTHSPLVITKTPIERIVVLSRDEHGAVKALRGRLHPALAAWKKDVAPGALYAAGILS